jgi:L-fuculose-phosphate aldolase
VDGTEIPLVSYETYGTERLAEAIVETLTDHDARGCVMENHGFLCYGESLDEAFDVAEAVEFTARVDCQSRMIGTPNELSPEEVRDVAEKFEGYGQSQ